MKKLLVIFLILFKAKIIIACTCVGKESLKDAYMYSDNIILGKIISKDTVSFKDSLSGMILKRNSYQVQVETYYKGKDKSQIITIISGFGHSDCGYIFEVGKMYIIYADKVKHPFFNNKELHNLIETNKCKRTKLYDKKEARKLERLQRKLDG